MPKQERLQLRMNDDDKNWFKTFCVQQGTTMSRKISEYVQGLRKRNGRECDDQERVR